MTSTPCLLQQSVYVKYVAVLQRCDCVHDAHLSDLAGCLWQTWVLLLTRTMG